MLTPDILASLELLPTFIKMVENDLGEDEHEVETPLTHDQFEQVERLVVKLNNCVNYVDQTIFD
jgi:hypothetical protein